MQSVVSGNYRKIDLNEAIEVSVRTRNAWKDPKIAARQFDAARLEIQRFREGETIAPFTTFVKSIKTLPQRCSFLEVGAAWGYYGEIMKLSDISMRYHAVDYSPDFMMVARNVYPNIQFDVAEATQLPYTDGQFDIVMDGSCVLHNIEYEQLIREESRVSSKYVIFHRLPLVKGPTEYYEKEAYGIPCLEIHFDGIEFNDILLKNGLTPIRTDVIFETGNYGHYTIICERGMPMPEPYASDKNV